MGKMRVHELAKELGKENKDILEALEGLGVQVSSHMSTVDEEVCEKIKRNLKRKTGQKKRENRKRRILFRYSARRTARPAWFGRDSGRERQDPAVPDPREEPRLPQREGRLPATVPQGNRKVL